MPISGFPTRRGLAFAGVALLLILPAAASAAAKGADLRVVNTGGQTLAEFRQYTSSVKIATDPGAECFGLGNGGSGDRVEVPGATALGAVRDALASDGDLRPLSVTDAFLDDGYGLGVCGIGGFEAEGSSYWYLKSDHVGAQVSGSLLKVGDGDDVLWYLTPTYPPGLELGLRAPPSAQPGLLYQVTAFAYADDGTRTRAAGATVNGALAPTDVNGHAMVTSPSAGTDVLQATRGSDIPSNSVEVCVDSDPSQCPDAHGRRVFGTGRGDEIGGTRGWDLVRSRGGADQVNIRNGGVDRIRCGGGRDRVILRHGDHDDEIASSCERVVRR